MMFGNILLKSVYILGIVAPIFLNTQVNSKWRLNSEKSSVVFIAKNIGLNVPGQMKGMKVSANYNEEDIFSSSFVGSIETATIDTKNSLRNNHLKSSDYFDVKKYPQITFKSKHIEKNGAVLAVVGDLTIKNVTKEVKINFTVDKKNNDTHIFTGDLNVKRIDFDLGMRTDIIMADEIKVRIIATFEKM